MSEHHLAEILEKNFLPGFDGQLCVLQGKALESGNVVFFCFKGNQGRGKLCHLMACLLGKAVAVSCGTGRLIGKPSGSNQNAVPLQEVSVR